MATKHAVQSEKMQEGMSKDRLQHLIKERKSHRAEGQDAKQISKQIRREIRAITRAVKGAKIEKIMQSFKGLKFIADIQKGGKKYKISSMTGTDGKQVSDEQGIADVFADFYESLYKKQHDIDGTQFFASGKHDTPEVTEEEIKVALKKMKNGMDREQTRDQVGFRKLYSCEDHLLVITLVAEMHLPLRQGVWIAALDFKKAFDSV